jgi:hypothetical protein
MRSLRKRLVLGGAVIVLLALLAAPWMGASLASGPAAPADPTMARPAAPGLSAVKETMKDAVKEAVGAGGAANAAAPSRRQ